MISGRLFVLKSKMNTTYLFWFNKVLMCFCFMVYSLAFGCFLSLLRIKYRYKVGGLITTLIYLFSIYGSKAIYKHFQFEKKQTFTNHETNRPSNRPSFYLPASIM
jgi:hypothetical protein